MCLPAEWFKAPLDRESSAWHWLGSGSSGRSKTGSTLSHRSLCAGAYCTAAAGVSQPTMGKMCETCGGKHASFG
eukprot:COSAG06_NODE_18606_length_877_cov_3.096401_1_plen_73_part_10